MNVAVAKVTSFSQKHHQTITLPLLDGTRLVAQNGLGGKELPAVAWDLLDLATAVFNIERQLTGRQRTDPAAAIDLLLPVRSRRSWTKATVETCEEVLRFLGNADWRITTHDRKLHRESEIADRGLRTAKRLVLFSGGLDSWCGAAITPRDDTQLMSFYTRQRTLQLDLAGELGFSEPVQWRWREKLPSGPGRSFFYRSFLFQALAAVTAISLNCEQILQFENGVLANAVAPAPSYRMTHHAHPHFLSLMERLIGQLFNYQTQVLNPFNLLTKREAVKRAEAAIGSEKTRAAISKTQSCWGYSSPRMPGGIKKRPGRHCGVCIPCIIRRTAFPDGEFARDLMLDKWKNSSFCGHHFRAYHGFLERVQGIGQDDARFFLLLDGSTRTDLIGGGYCSLQELRSLYQRFAQEFKETFLG
jgi:7-cyano-7-deazaguanine synthase in queuosine biosynthesis